LGSGSRDLVSQNAGVIIIIMGAAGAGKTTVGRALATRLGWRFIEADDLHSAANIDKMRHGDGLTREDRLPWLHAVRRQLKAADQRGESVVVACSALTREYRAILSDGLTNVQFVYLQADPQLLAARLEQRQGHFAGPSLLATQLATLEEPGDTALTLDASASPPALVTAIREALKA
jgi:gluconokinase